MDQEFDDLDSMVEPDEPLESDLLKVKIEACLNLNPDSISKLQLDDAFLNK